MHVGYYILTTKINFQVYREMPSNYKRKTNQQGWDSGAMQQAIRAVRDEGMGYATAAKNFNVPRNTLKRRVLHKNVDAVEDKKILGKFRSVFSCEQERELLNHILELEKRFFGVSITDLRRLAFQLAEKNNIPHPFNNDTKMAGKDWVACFRKRHPNISLRKPESTSAARAQAFNRPNVERFFGILTEVQEKHFHPAHRIFNVDETGLSTVQSKNTKVLSLKGKRQVGAITSAEKGLLSTFAVCMSAGGNYVPPLVIFPRKRMKVELQDGAPPGTVFACNPSGWMQTDIFNQWFDHFLNHTKPTIDDPVLLILDGHATHTKNIEFIEKARKNHTTVVCLPPHSSHKLQPLDVSFMAPFNTYYVQAVEKFLRNNPGRVVTQFQVSKLLGEAFVRAALPGTAINGFRKCGIVPLDPHVFSDADFAAAEVTDIPEVNDYPGEVSSNNDAISDGDEEMVGGEDAVPGNGGDTAANSKISVPCSKVVGGGGEDVMPDSDAREVGTEETADVSEDVAPNNESDGTRTRHDKNISNKCLYNSQMIDSEPSTSFAVSPKDIVPLPKSNVSKRKTNHRKGKAAIITSSPYKTELLEEKTRKDGQNKRKATNSSRVSENKIPNLQTKNKNKSEMLKKKPTKLIRSLFNEQEADESDDTDCLYCKEAYSNSKTNEMWIRCSGCHQWAHEVCACCEDEDVDFLCEDCSHKTVVFTKK